jgi:hypothetical protein
MIKMEGYTISEMAKELGIAPNTVMQRLYVAKIKPITKEALYDKSAIESIRNVPSKGRPKRATPDLEPAKPDKSSTAKKPAKGKNEKTPPRK